MLKGDDKSAIEHKAEALAKASAPGGAARLPGRAAALPPEAGASAKPGADAGKDDVLDAEFEEIKDQGGKPH